MDPEPSPDLARSAEGRGLASLLVGITRNTELQGADVAVRRALNLAFDRLDLRCPLTPKILLTALAPGADVVAAQAALARPDWSVIAVLAVREDTGLSAGDEKARSDLEKLKAHPRVKSIVLDPLQKAGAHTGRADHDEQAALFISERAAILIGVLEVDPAPGVTQDAARVVRHRLTGELDATARRVVNHSTVLEEPPRLVDRHTGPVWLVDLAALAQAPDEPAKALLVSTPGCATPAALGENHMTSSSLRLANSIEEINRRIARIDTKTWTGIVEATDAGPGDAASHLRRLRLALEAVQEEIVTRVRRSIWALAMLSVAAILAFEVYVAWAEQTGAKLFAIAYPFLVGAAGFVYWRVAHGRWQRFAEDYRAAAEGLRVQLVWWASGLTGRKDRIERDFLCGAHRALKQLRFLISSLIDEALLRFDRPAPDPAAANLWVSEQIDFFSKRIRSRQGEIAFVEAASWFLFVASFTVALYLATDLVLDLARQTLQPPHSVTKDHSAGLIGSAIPTLDGAFLQQKISFAAAVAAFLGLSVFAITPRRLTSDDEPDAVVAKSNLVVGLAGVGAGWMAASGITDFATILLAARHDYAGEVAWVRELMGIAVILPASVAGAIRYVSEKSSWSAELTGYEHARDHFLRGKRALASIADPSGAGGPEHREIVRALGEEALSENENWLRSHRDRPLEPLVGG